MMEALIALIEEEHSDENLDDPITLCNLLNSEFGTNFTKSDICDFYILEQHKKDMSFIETEDAILMRKHSYNI